MRTYNEIVDDLEKVEKEVKEIPTSIEALDERVTALEEAPAASMYKHCITINASDVTYQCHFELYSSSSTSFDRNTLWDFLKKATVSGSIPSYYEKDIIVGFASFMSKGYISFFSINAGRGNYNLNYKECSTGAVTSVNFSSMGDSVIQI